MAKIGLLGGTFDPIHIGHLLLGQWAQEEFGLEEVWFMPAGNPYFKEGRKIASEADRLSMTELAVSGNKTWRVCDAEIGRGGDTYTFETVDLLNREYPQHDFYFIFGADCLDSLHHWRYPERILSGCRIIAAARGAAKTISGGVPAAEDISLTSGQAGSVSDAMADEKDPRLTEMFEKARNLMEQFGGEISVMNFPALEISSTMIRERIREGKDIRYLIPECVEDYIRKNALYR